MAGSGIIFNGKMFRGMDELVAMWGQYFKSLHGIADSQVMKETWRKFVEKKTVDETLRNMKTYTSVRVPTSFFESAIENLLSGKPGSSYGVVYKHFLKNKPTIAPVLSNVFTFMLRRSYSV